MLDAHACHPGGVELQGGGPRVWGELHSDDSVAHVVDRFEVVNFTASVSVRADGTGGPEGGFCVYSGWIDGNLTATVSIPQSVSVKAKCIAIGGVCGGVTSEEVRSFVTPGHLRSEVLEYFQGCGEHDRS